MNFVKGLKRMGEQAVDKTSQALHMHGPPPAVRVGGRQVQPGKLIAEGGFGFVFQAQDTENGARYALKKINVRDSDHLVNVQNEIQIMSTMPAHKNVVTFLGAEQTAPNEVYILMEFCPEGMTDVMKTRTAARGFTEAEILQIFTPMCEAVAHMHSQNPIIAHRDIKIENYLRAENGALKLCDFGSCTTKVFFPQTVHERQALEDEIQGNTTPIYRAPEMCDMYSGKPVTEKVDIWALGCVLYKLAFFVTPFEEGNKMQILNCQWRIPETSRYSENLHNFMRYMINPDPNDRPDIFDVLDRVAALRGVQNPIPRMSRATPAFPTASAPAPAAKAPASAAKAPAKAAPAAGGAAAGGGLFGMLDWSNSSGQAVSAPAPAAALAAAPAAAPVRPSSHSNPPPPSHAPYGSRLPASVAAAPSVALGPPPPSVSPYGRGRPVANSNPPPVRAPGGLAAPPSAHSGQPSPTSPFPAQPASQQELYAAFGGDPFAAQQGKAADPFAANSAPADPFAAKPAASDPFGSAADPFAARAGDPFGAAPAQAAPARSPFGPASMDPFGAAPANASPSNDPFAQRDPFAASASAGSAPAPTPFAAADPFSAAPAPAPAPALPRSASNSNLDPFNAGPPSLPRSASNSNLDPFMAAQPAGGARPASSSNADPFLMLPGGSTPSSTLSTPNGGDPFAPRGGDPFQMAAPTAAPTAAYTHQRSNSAAPPMIADWNRPVQRSVSNPAFPDLPFGAQQQPPRNDAVARLATTNQAGSAASSGRSTPSSSSGWNTPLGDQPFMAGSGGAILQPERAGAPAPAAKKEGAGATVKNGLMNLGDMVKSAFASDREKWLNKATDSSKVPPKPKHVRSLVLETWEASGAGDFYSCLSRRPCLTDAIVCFKALNVVHHMLQDGHPRFLVASAENLQQFNAMRDNWRQRAAEVPEMAQLLDAYVNFIILKIQFHARRTEVEGNYSIDSYLLRCRDEGLKIKNGQGTLLFDDTLQSLLDLQQAVDAVAMLATADFGPLQELKLGSLIPCVVECYGNYQLTSHLAHHLIALRGVYLVQRFSARYNERYNQLRRFLTTCEGTQVISNIIAVPQVGGSPPVFQSTPAVLIAAPLSNVPVAFRAAMNGQLSLLDYLDIPQSMRPAGLERTARTGDAAYIARPTAPIAVERTATTAPATAAPQAAAPFEPSFAAAFGAPGSQLGVSGAGASAAPAPSVFSVLDTSSNANSAAAPMMRGASGAGSGGGGIVKGRDYLGGGGGGMSSRADSSSDEEDLKVNRGRGAASSTASAGGAPAGWGAAAAGSGGAGAWGARGGGIMNPPSDDEDEFEAQLAPGGYGQF